MPSPEFERIDVHRFSKFVDFGGALLKHSYLNNGEMTQTGLRNISQLLTEGGSVILDAHRTRTDIFCVGAQLVDNLDINRGVVPYAEYLDTKRLYRFILQIIRKKLGDRIELFRVVREEIRKGERSDIKINLTEEEMDDLNRTYEERVSLLPHETGTILFAAAYGSREKYRQKGKIRRVSIDVLKHGCPLICTYAVKVPDSEKQTIGPYEVFVSDHILRFAPDATKEEIRDAIDAEYDYLERKAQEEYPLEGVKLFIFDWSGTLSDDRSSVYEANMRLLEHYEIERISFEKWLKGTETTANAAEFLSSCGVNETHKELQRLFEERLDQVKEEGVKPEIYPDARHTLEAVRKIRRRKKNKVPIVVLSAHPKKEVEEETKRYDVSRFISNVVADVGVREKTQAIQDICEKYKLHPSQIVLVGDTTYDMEAARKAGVRTVAVTGGFHSREKLEAENPTLIVDSLEEIISYLS